MEILVENYIGEIKIDLNEVSEVRWFEFDNLPENINKADIRPITEVIKYIKERSSWED